MPKVSTNALTREPRQMLEPQPVFRSTDGSVEFSVPMRKLREIERAVAQDRARELIEKYITGIGKEGDKDYTPPMFIGMIAGEPAFITPSTALVAATLERAQCCAPEDRYTAEEFALFMNDEGISDTCAEVYYKLPMERSKEKKAESSSLDSQPPSTASTEA